MRKRIIYILLTGILIANSCKSYNDLNSNDEIIKFPCELNKHINDTILISGKYSGCMEYTSFNLIENDNCYEDFDMQLIFDNVELTEKHYRIFSEIEDCAASMKMILKGVLRKEMKKEYGHLGTNNAEFEVLEFVYLGKVKYKKIKTD